MTEKPSRKGNAPMVRLLTTTAIGLIAGLALQIQAETGAEAQQMDTDGTTQISAQVCPVSWTEVDADGNGRISREEAEAVINVEFSRIDQNDDDVVSIKEWKDCFAPSAIPGGFEAHTQTGADDKTAEDEAAEADTEESARTVQGPEITGVSEPLTIDSWTQEQFAEMDIDDSGDVTAQEAEAWSRAQALEEVELARFAGLFGLLDQDGGGTITTEEWENREDVDIERHFGNIDEDGDGQIGLSEWRDYREERFGQAGIEPGEGLDPWGHYSRM